MGTFRGGGREGWGWLGGCGCHVERYNFHAPTGASTGGHEEGSPVVWGGDGDSLGLVGTAASCCLLCAGGVFVKSFCQALLQLKNIIAI